MAAADWEISGRDPSLLLRGRRLEELRAWETSAELALAREEQEYLVASARERDRQLDEDRARAERERTLERRSVGRLRALVAVLTVAVLVATGLTTIATNRAREAERLRTKGRIAALTGSSLTNLDANPDRSVLLALHAVSLSASRGDPVPSETVEALHWAMQEAGVAYPASEGDDVAVVAGPFGTRGIFDLPVGVVAQAARSDVSRDLTASECQTYFESDACPSLPRSFSRDLPFDRVREVKPAPGEPVVALPPLTGTRVTLHWNLHNDPAAFEPFKLELDAFTRRTGVEVDFIDFPEEPNWITPEQAAEDPPDLAFVIPGIGADLARRGYLVDMSTFVDSKQLAVDQSPYLVSLGTLGRDGSWPADSGTLFAAFAQVSVKSLIWYPVPELRDTAPSLPSTWEELVGLSRRLQRRGETPWCMGWASGEASGWPGTDWIENLLLAGEGLETYDAWSFHELPFDSPEIRLAFDRLSGVLFEDGSVLGGPQTASERAFEEAQFPMLEDPPQCSLYLQATFAAGAIAPEDVGRSTDVFPFPPMANQTGGVIGGGEMVGTFSDRPEVRELVRFLLSPQHGVELAEVGHDYMSPNRRFDLDNYPNEFWRRQAELVQAALAADTFRFDASDLMPPEVGAGRFWDAMMRYLDEGPDSVDDILTELDTAWPDDTS
jgi:alpha-glucoside transport system substrate-binding protein